MYRYLFFLMLLGCSPAEELVEGSLNLELRNANSISFEDGEATIDALNVQGQIEEVGIVWSTKPQPIYTDFRASVQNIKTDISLDLAMPKLSVNQTYYVRAYWKQGLVVNYSKDELSFNHAFNKQWFREESPKVESSEYVASDIAYFSVSRGGIRYKRVDKHSNMSQETAFFPNFGRWDPSYVRVENPEVPMVFNPFYCDLAKPNLRATLIGGGYYKKSKNEKFYLKTFRFDGSSGYKWDPDYSGSNTEVSAFGIEDRPYVIENIPNGRVLHYSYKPLSWIEKAKVPINIEGKFKAASDFNRPFVLHEPQDFSLPLSFYEFIEKDHSWEKRAPFPGENRRNATFFHHNGRFYYGIGQSAATKKPLRDIWVYTPSTNSWAKFADYPGIGSLNVTAVGLDEGIYFGFGQKVSVNSVGGETYSFANDFWIYYF